MTDKANVVLTLDWLGCGRAWCVIVPFFTMFWITGKDVLTLTQHEDKGKDSMGKDFSLPCHPL